MYYPPYYEVPYYQTDPNEMRQQLVNGQATWTYGGNVSYCNIPWSSNQYMTAAVSGNTPYQCGQKIKVINPQTSDEIEVTIVDIVPNAPANSLNLHRRAFEALGADPSVGIIPVRFQASSDDESEWDDYLLHIIQAAYPSYQVNNYNFVEKTDLGNSQVKEVFDFSLQNSQGWINLRAYVIYNTNTGHPLSFNVIHI